MAKANHSIVPPRARADAPAIAAVLSALSAQFGTRLVTSQAVRQQHANTATWVENQPPDAVVFARTAGEVRSTVQVCADHGVPVIPYGTGTSLEGHVNAPLGGISIDLSEMNRIVAVHPEDLDCVVEPGVTRKQLNEFLRDQGVFFPIDPGADASLGGMAATRASGTNAVRYGTMRDNVLALQVVVANGELLRTGTRAKKSAAGYDLTRLFVGSEMCIRDSYGTMRDNVLALQVVVANGELLRTGTRAKKSAAGYDLTCLLYTSDAAEKA